jgi:alpha-ketoglutarate-dependent taurine dioxygenase
MPNYAAKSAAWDEQVATTARIRLSEDTTAIPLTPLIGAEISGFDLTEDLSDDALETITDVLTKYKVVMLRSEGHWKMDPEQHTRFCQRISAHWGIEADTPQKRLNASRGLSVHPFLPWLKDYPHIWPTGSVTGGGQQFKLRSSEEVENFEPFAGEKSAKSPTSKTEPRDKANAIRSPRPGSYGANALKADSVENGANAFHFDDGFFHQPPSAVVLNAVVLPKLGGDTIFSDMGAAFNGLSPELQARCKTLTQTMDWTHVFPVWEREAARRAEAGDHALRIHVDQLKKDYPPSTQPLIRKHPVTGQLSIYANLGFTQRINEVSSEDSRAILANLYRLAERPEYQVRLRWHNEGDVCIYDNRITNHYAVADYGAIGPRSLHHIALLGEPTQNADGQIVG